MSEETCGDYSKETLQALLKLSYRCSLHSHESLWDSSVIEHTGKKGCQCRVCAKPCPGYDHIIQKWRHLDTCQFQTILVARVPRVQCPEHKVLAIDVPWAESDSRYTALFEAWVIDWLKEATTKAVARPMKLSWNAIDGIGQRAVNKRSCSQGCPTSKTTSCR
ncbi:MAG: hypothetical protein GKR94_04185 [Gammaproteobacteria bacterium]|nr:hypothetical protein [Gammaproteobacteria bacterium]